MATIAIGDIHGNLAALTDLLSKLRGEIAKGDQVVFLGDYIDRGPDTKGCVDAILDFRAGTPATVVCLMGNHEDWFLKTRDNHHEHSWLLGMDGWPTVRSYSEEAADHLAEAARAAGNRLYLGTVSLPYDAFFEAMPNDHLAFFDALAPYHVTDDCISVHAGVDTRGIGLEHQPRSVLVWGWDDGGFPRNYLGRTAVVYGHRNNAVLNEQGWPQPNVIGRTVGIDSSRERVLTAYRLPDGQVFQSARHEY
jgi:serine/threonine protein phosphatase 1